MDLQHDAKTLLQYCQERDWAGFDPYDGLNSRLFQATPLRHSALARLALIQGVKRCPVNIRPMLGIPRVQNAKGVALFATAAMKLHRLGWADRNLGRLLADQLLTLRSPGYDAVCWGYPFDWQNRHFMLPRNHPNIICSTFGGHALLDAFEHYADPAYLQAASSVGDFVLRHLNRTPSGDSFCFSYTPLDHGQVHNANLLGAAFLARLARQTGDEGRSQEALQAAKYTVDRQRADGSWVYGEAPNQQWVDGFHTGYNLVALLELLKAAPTPWLAEALDRGYAYYREHFFAPDGAVKYFHDRTLPLDIHSVSQAVITCAAFAGRDPGALPAAQRVLAWANTNLRSPEGYYYFQKRRWWTVRTPFMRWSQAWMLYAMACLAEAKTPPSGAQRGVRTKDRPLEDLRIDWPNSSASTFAAYNRALGQKVVEIGGVHWRKVRPFFFRPLLVFQPMEPGHAVPPPAARWGGHQHAVPEGAAANSHLDQLVFTDVPQYALSGLDYNRRRQVRLAARTFSIRRIVDIEEFTRKAHPVYLSFHERTGYTYGTQRRNRYYFASWAESLFQLPDLVILGGFAGDKLGGVSVSLRVDDTLIYATYFSSSEALRGNLSDLMLHTIRASAAAGGAIRRIYVGMMKGRGDEFYFLRGCSRVRQPALLRLNPVSRCLLERLMPSSYARMKGEAFPETTREDPLASPDISQQARAPRE